MVEQKELIIHITDTPDFSATIDALIVNNELFINLFPETNEN